jgi:tRNA 2-thiouridine synthesizing protein A
MAMQTDVQLDTLGLFCPMPIIKTSKKIKELKVGQVLEVISDDEGIKKDMPAWCETTGHEYLGLEEEVKGGSIHYRTYVKKTK